MSIDMLADQLAQHRPEVRHCLTLAGFATLDTTDRNALLSSGARLLHQLHESTTAQMRRPPQPLGRGDRGLDVIGAEDQRAAPHDSLDLCSVARRPFALPLTHLRNDTPQGGAKPLPQTPTQRPSGARLF